ncbi:MAG: division/cell wall cluster transcriptional repressor MraZ [Candidatus Faecivicinus sp.]
MGNAEFSGNYSHNIDPKGRATIPSAYREALGENFTLGLNNQFNALALYPAEEWEKISARLNRIPVSDARGMAYVRLIKAFSYTDQKLDGQGRLLIPNGLRDKVGMDKAITFVGVGRFLEIWDTARFNEFCAASEADFAELMDYVNDRYFGANED